MFTINRRMTTCSGEAVGEAPWLSSRRESWRLFGKAVSGAKQPPKVWEWDGRLYFEITFLGSNRLNDWDSKSIKKKKKRGGWGRKLLLGLRHTMPNFCLQHIFMVKPGDIEYRAQLLKMTACGVISQKQFQLGVGWGGPIQKQCLPWLSSSQPHHPPPPPPYIRAGVASFTQENLKRPGNKFSCGIGLEKNNDLVFKEHPFL